MTFKIKYDLYIYKIMQFRIFNALANFCSYINKILIEKFDIFVIDYLDNIFFFIEKSSHINFS